MEVVKLNYTDIVSVHYRYSGEVYNNNALRYYGREILRSVLRVHGEQPGGPSSFLFFNSMY